MATNTHQADDSWLGYVFQGLFALVELLNADDDQCISVETADDVVLSGAFETLYQLKHSTGTPASLTLRSDALWKTFAIWSQPDDGARRLNILVTCARVPPNDGVFPLTVPKSDRTATLAALETEAQRVLSAIQVAIDAKQPRPFRDREAGCSAFLALTPTERRELVHRILVKPESFNINDIPELVSDRLKPLLPPNIRSQVCERLIEWWDRRIMLALLGKLPTEISKLELQLRLHELAREHGPDGLPDDFADLEPDDYEAELGGNMQRQIELVKGGKARLKRAARVRWQARSQRQKWMEQDISIPAMLTKFDHALVRQWRDYHEPMAEECSIECNETKCTRGLDLLDWSHHKACNEVPPPRPGWNSSYLIQGTYQQLADQLDVGWHPDYDSILKPGEGGSQ